MLRYINLEMAVVEDCVENAFEPRDRKIDETRKSSTVKMNRSWFSGLPGPDCYLHCTDEKSFMSSNPCNRVLDRVLRREFIGYRSTETDNGIRFARLLFYLV